MSFCVSIHITQNTSYSSKATNEKQKAKKRKLQPEPELENDQQPDSTGSETDESTDLI